MRRTRWDQKPEEAIASGSRWNNQCNPLHWEHHNRPQDAITDERERLSTPHPLDYSSDGRQRDQKNATNDTNKDKTDSSHGKDTSDSIGDQSSIHHPSHWSYVSNMQHIYPSSSQNAQMPYPPHTPWNQFQQGFYSNGDFHRDHIFDMKWWEEQRQPLGAHLTVDEGTTSKEQQKFDPSRPAHWSFGTRVLKHNDRSFEYARRYARYQSGTYDRNNKVYRDSRNFSQNSNLNNRYNNKYDSYKVDRRPLLSERDSQSHHRLWRYNNREYPDHAKPQDYSQAYRPNLGINTNNGGFVKKNAIKFKSLHKSSSKDTNQKANGKHGDKLNLLKQRKKEKKKDSAAEIAKKKALAAAANKLKQTFLAAKKNTDKKSNKKSKEALKQIKSSLIEETAKTNLLKKAKVRDLSVPKSIPKEGTSLEHDIDIKFSASEWESVGRGEGGTQNVLDLPTAVGSKYAKEDSDSDSDSVQTINDVEFIKGSSDSESENSESDDDENPVTWSSEQMSPTPLRRRHASESITIEAEPYTNQSRIRRVRSYSTSQVEQSSPEKSCSKTSPLTYNLKNMLVKQLLAMDKKSLKELVDDPKSRKAQFMMNHFMTMHKNTLSQKLNQLRFKSISSSSSVVDDDLNVLQSFNPAHLEALPSDILEQVKEILDFEATGKAQQMWEEVSLSLSDLVCGFEGVDKAEKPILPEDIEQQQQQQQQQHHHHHHHQQKQPTNSPHDNGVDDPDCQIVTPPPKQPTTTITIPDSDNEIPSDTLHEDRDRDTSCPSLLINSSVDKSIPPISPHSSPSPPQSGGSFLKPQDLTHPSSSLDHPDRPPNPVPWSPPLSHMLSPPHSIKQLPHPTAPGNPHTHSIRHPSSPFLPPNPSIDTKRLKINIKNKIAEDSDLSNGREACEINLQPPPSIKVKQERPSPMMECGLCMHPPRSPHTPQCGFAFGIPPPPVALMPGSPRPLGAVPPQRPVPHLASSAVPTIFKQERQTGSYLNLEHINRPSSEERPKNPAPPDTTNNEPPSPLPIPPPQSTLHQPPPPPRPLIFSPDEQFAEPPRPPSPPPPQHSPRIKLERQTPQFICCCMRNECERSNSSRQSADFRRGAATPQGQLCESATLRATPHSVYKYEPPYLSGLRSRTPHSAMVNMFPSVSPSGRCLGPPNSHAMQGIVPNHCLSVVHNDGDHNSKVNVGVQTEKLSRQFVPNISLARSVTPISSKIDQTTSTEDLTHSSNNSSSEEVDNNASDDGKQIRNKRDTFNSCSVPTSSVPNDHVATVVNKFKDFKPIGCLTSQLIQLSSHENEILICLDIIERKERELAKERKRLKEVLHRIHEMRLQKLIQQQSDDGKATSSSNLVNEISNTETHPRSHEDVSTNDDEVVSNSIKNDETIEHQICDNNNSNNSTENQYMVSSSQEVSTRFKSPVSPSEYFSNDSQSHSIQGERCTSTSLVERKEVLFQNVKESSDSEDDIETAKKFGIKTNIHHKYRLGKTCFMNRNRLNSGGSTSDEFQEEKIKEEVNKSSSTHSSNGNTNVNDECSINGSDIDIKNEELLADSSHMKLRKDREKGAEDLDFSHQGTSLVKEEHEHICNLTSNRKSSLTGSPQSPKMRNSSGSEHGYSLRSRGPPSDLFDFNSDSQLSKDTLISSQEDQLEMSEDKQSNHDKNDDDQADDEFEKEEEMEMRTSSRLSTDDNFKKRKRKKKTKYQMNKCRKKKEIDDIYSSNGNKEVNTCSSSHLEELKTEIQNGGDNSEEQLEPQKKNENLIPLQEEFKVPPPHLDAILDLKVVGNLIFTTSIDGTARLFDPVSGVILSTYQSHTNSVTAIQIVGEPQFTIGSPRFQVVTGSEDCSIHVYDGKTGVLTQRKNCTESVRCLDYRWGYLFVGTDGGCGIKWNLKDKKLGEKIQFCGKGITRILTHVEGGRKVLVVGAKTTPIMIRDAMSGLFLRTLEYVQLAMYAAVFEGNLLYTGGSDKNIYVYDYCGGNLKEQFPAEASISGLILRDNHLVTICYDGYVRIFRLPKGDLVHTIQVESSSNMFICSALFRNKVLLGNKNGEVVCCELPNLEKKKNLNLNSC